MKFNIPLSVLDYGGADGLNTPFRDKSKISIYDIDTQKDALSKNSLNIDSECTKCGNHYYSYRGDSHTKKRNRLFCMLK